jgi:hypothetical protein
LEDATVIKMLGETSMLNSLGDEEAEEVAATDRATEDDEAGMFKLELSCLLADIEEVKKIAEDELSVEEIWAPLVELDCLFDETPKLLEEIATDEPSVDEFRRLMLELSCPLDDIEGLVLDEGRISILELDENTCELKVELNGIETLEDAEKAVLELVPVLNDILGHCEAAGFD